MLAATEQVRADRLSRSVEATFSVRGTHPTPNRLPEPPVAWLQPFGRLAAETANLPTTDLRSLRTGRAVLGSPPGEPHRRPDLATGSGAVERRALIAARGGPSRVPPYGRGRPPRPWL
jgi:hypothetical protein